MFASAHPTSLRGTPLYSTGLVVLYVVFVAVFVVLLLVVLFVRWPGGPEDVREADRAPREDPPGGPDPMPGPCDDEALWSDFERQFAEYVSRRTPGDRRNVGRSQPPP